MRHDAACSNNAVNADLNTGEDDRAKPYEALIAQHDGTFAVDRLIHDQATPGIHAMAYIRKIDLIAKDTPASQLNAINAMELAIWAHIAIVSNNQSWCETLVQVACYWLQKAVGTKHHSVTDLNAMSIDVTQRGGDADTVAKSPQSSGSAPVPAQLSKPVQRSGTQLGGIAVVGFGAHWLAKVHSPRARACAMTNARLRFLRDVDRVMPRPRVVQTV